MMCTVRRIGPADEAATVAISPSLRHCQICKQGHLFCRECIYTSILEQKASIAAYKVSLEKLAAEQQQQREQARQRARQKVLEEFEKGVGFGHLTPALALEGDESADGDDGRATLRAGSKRKGPPLSKGIDVAAPLHSTLSTLPARAQKLALAAELRALEEIEEEQRSSRRSKLPSFWVPSLTPSEREGDVDLRKMTEGMDVRCRVASEQGHALSIKSLKSIKFSESSSGAKTCPTCAKQFSSNNSLHALRSCCGGVVCARCYTELVAKPLATTGDKELLTCPCCGVGFKDPARDVIALHREGTGYAGGGGVSEVKAKGTTFQG